MHTLSSRISIVAFVSIDWLVGRSFSWLPPKQNTQTHFVSPFAMLCNRNSIVARQNSWKNEMLLLRVIFCMLFFQLDIFSKANFHFTFIDPFVSRLCLSTKIFACNFNESHSIVVAYCAVSSLDFEIMNRTFLRLLKCFPLIGQFFFCDARAQASKQAQQR